jgi:hypothetical protein
MMRDPTRVGLRVWRARKHHTWIDAQLQPSADRTGFELRFLYDGALVLSRVWPTRQEAVAYADEQLRELQRAGWNTHW